MRGVAGFFCCLGFLGAAFPALAEPCRGNPQALGTSRTIAISHAEYAKLGTVHYAQSPQLPLRDHEVVLTFDDGPLPPFSNAVLDALAKDCVRVTFFMVGRQAAAFPDVARRVYKSGHSVGTHSQNHPLTFDQMPIEAAQREIDDGITSVSLALGDRRAVAPFFRIPGFLRIAPVEDYLGSRAITVWSTDFDADDWYKNATPKDIVTKAMTRLEAKGRGILLLHDVQPATALAVPMLLQELKARGYKIVHVTAAGPKPRQPRERVSTTGTNAAQGWPRVTRRR